LTDGKSDGDHRRSTTDNAEGNYDSSTVAEATGGSCDVLQVSDTVCERFFSSITVKCFFFVISVDSNQSVLIIDEVAYNLQE